VLIDQVFALVSVRDEQEDRVFWRSYYLGAGALAWSMWQVVVAVGVLAGPVLPEGLSLEFAIPILFIGLVVPTLVRRPALVAAVTAVAVTTVLHGIPNRGGMLVGALAGVAVGTVVDLRGARR
jgi:predicted branched-subunit amino acid permease